MSDIEKMDLESADLVADRIASLKELFPEITTEGSGSIDFDKLRVILGDEANETPERYAFAWPGKAAAIRQSQTPSTATLRPLVEKSRSRNGEDGSFDSDNIYIEGDNLEVLKLLQRGYHGKIKMIYIDPPYNTGHDFVYHDNFGDTIENYKNQVGLTGQSNPNTSGRFHSDWCSMIYPRLRLARELLTEDGVIFISIGEEEVSALRLICEEIFGQANFIGDIIWQSRTSISNDDLISTNHNHTLIFAKFRQHLVFGGDAIDASEYSNPDNDPRGPWKLVPIDANHAGGDTYFAIANPNTGIEYYPPNGRSWAYNRETVSELLSDRRIIFGTTGKAAPKRKLFLNERILKGDVKTPSSLLLDAGTTKEGTEEIMHLFGDKVFDFPKPSSLVQRLLQYGIPNANGVFLDFFSGSASSAHAVLSYNLLNNGNCRFICVQLPEDLDNILLSSKLDTRKSAQRATNFLNSIGAPRVLTEIGEERIRRAGDKIKAEVVEANQQLKLSEDPKQLPDIGFRVFTLDDSNIQTPQPGELLDNVVKPDRSELDLVCEMMLKWGLDLTLPVEQSEASGYPIWSVAHNELICCMAEKLNLNALEAIAKLEPRRVLILDSILTDTLKLNATQIFKHASKRTGNEIELRTI